MRCSRNRARMGEEASGLSEEPEGGQGSWKSRGAQDIQPTFLPIPMAYDSKHSRGVNDLLKTQQQVSIGLKLGIPENLPGVLSTTARPL